MRTLSSLAIAALALGWAATTAAAQPGSADPGVAGPYAGAGPHAFYDVGQRIDHLQQVIASGALPAGASRRAMSQLRAIKGELQFRTARHNGDLRDWDRELISKKLDELVSQYPALQG